MKQKDIHIKGDRIHALFSGKHAYLSNFYEVIAYLVQEPIPSETIMITLEEHDTAGEMCEIVMCVSKNSEYLGRREQYARCIYSGFSDILDRLVVVDNVGRHPGYLALDPRVRSEMFLETDLNGSSHLILNAEFSSGRVNPSTKKWFQRLTDILTE
ncbi:MAG: hypothetical protein JXB23_04865 [Candidatus Aminicenantes bacterium]|nr:hypothetical protein [Candidatus Aminicenantes bacterium]